MNIAPTPNHHITARFVPDPRAIKDRISCLIEKDYIKRSDNNMYVGHACSSAAYVAEQLMYECFSACCSRA